MDAEISDQHIRSGRRSVRSPGCSGVGTAETVRKRVGLHLRPALSWARARCLTTAALRFVSQSTAFPKDRVLQVGYAVDHRRSRG